MLCPNCEKSELELVPSDWPWYEGYWICPLCEAAYLEGEEYEDSDA